MWTLEVEEGQRINITFLYFEMAAVSCRADWVELISDNYKSRHCGETTEPWSIITESHLIIRFSSNEVASLTGFLALWSPTTAPPTYQATVGCGNCIFPFVFNGRMFDTCTSIDGDQPWCQADLASPINEGTHLINMKSYCPDTDASCPSTPQMSTHTNNQPGNCCKF